MSTKYSSFTDKEKIELCIEYVALGSPMPIELQEFLKSEGLLTKITKPRRKYSGSSKSIRRTSRKSRIRRNAKQGVSE